MKKIIWLATLLISSSSYAGSDIFTIKTVGISENSQTLFITTDQSHTQSECQNKSAFRYSINKSNSLHKEFYSGLLAAKMSGQSVNLGFTDDAASCLYDSPQIKYVSIE